MSLIPTSTHHSTSFLGELDWFATSLNPVDRAVLVTVAYADIFDYPLTIEDLHRYLIGNDARIDCVRSSVENPDLNPKIISAVDQFITLNGREENVRTRLRRTRVSTGLWPAAFRYGKSLAKLPFVRMVAITGALAVNNVENDADIDYLILTEPGRLWLSRAWCILLVRVASLRGITICPNYFLSIKALNALEKSLYSAHEVAQMVPLSGHQYYSKLRVLNPWVSDYLPNAGGPPIEVSDLYKKIPTLKKVLEYPQQSRFGTKLESWEMDRKISKFSELPGAESQFTRDQCKGHFDLHGDKTRKALFERLSIIDALL